MLKLKHQDLQKKLTLAQEFREDSEGYVTFLHYFEISLFAVSQLGVT